MPLPHHQRRTERDSIVYTPHSRLAAVGMETAESEPATPRSAVGNTPRERLTPRERRWEWRTESQNRLTPRTPQSVRTRRGVLTPRNAAEGAGAGAGVMAMLLEQEGFDMRMEALEDSVTQLSAVLAQFFVYVSLSNTANEHLMSSLRVPVAAADSPAAAAVRVAGVADEASLSHPSFASLPSSPIVSHALDASVSHSLMFSPGGGGGGGGGAALSDRPGYGGGQRTWGGSGSRFGAQALAQTMPTENVAMLEKKIRMLKAQV